MSGLNIDDQTAVLLQRYGFDTALFQSLRERASTIENTVQGRLDAPGPDEIARLPGPGTAAREALAARGLSEIAAGRVGVITLAGGMATRFGGVVKATVEALDGFSFLELKLRDLHRLAAKADATIPCFLMTSFATHDEVTELAGRATTDAVPIRTFPQGISLRLSTHGALFRDAEGRVSPYAPGHGDLPSAARTEGVLSRFRRGGGQLLYVSNVDNLGATLDPAVIGAHVEAGQRITSEVVGKEPGDRGGAPARVDGMLQIVEAFRFPTSFDQDTIGVFNTNSFVVDVEALEREHPLTWFAVKKNIEGRPAVQLERLVGQLTAFEPTHFLHVARGGPDGRFQPVKDPAELSRRAPAIRSLLQARGIL